MKDTQFDIIVGKLDEYARETMRKKGPEYTMQDTDVLNNFKSTAKKLNVCLLYTSPSPRDLSTSRMPSSA